MPKHFNIRVTGRVQGVFYRASALKAAEQFGIKGFVRNEPDGSVYIEAEGEEESLKDFIDWCKAGPPAATVIKVSFSESALTDFDLFEISG